MAAVSINQGMPGPEEPVLMLPRERWRLLAMARRQWAEIDLPRDCRLLRTVVDEAQLLAEEVGLTSGEAFLTEYLSLDLDLVQRVVGWLDQEKPAEPVPMERADLASRAEKNAAAAFDLKGTFAQVGDNQHTLKDAGSDNVRPSLKGSAPAQGNSAAYLAARLKKEGREDLLAQVGPGKPYRSIRAAAIEAGIIRPVPTVRLVADHEKVAAAIARHLTHEQLSALVEVLSHHLHQPPGA